MEGDSMPPSTTGRTKDDTRSARLLMLAVVLGIVTVILLNVYVERIRSEANERSFRIYQLNLSVAPGYRLKDRDVVAVDVPERFRESFSNAVDAVGLQIRIGDAFQRSASRGDILTYNLFTPVEGADEDRAIADGKRLVSLPINSQTVPGNLRPGMFVDIEAAFATGQQTAVVMPVMERVRVFAVGQLTESMAEATTGRPRSIGGFRSITIEVEPLEATYLSMIAKRAVGEFELHIRNPSDMTLAKIPDGGINPAVLKLVDPRRR